MAAIVDSAQCHRNLLAINGEACDNFSKGIIVFCKFRRLLLAFLGLSKFNFVLARLCPFLIVEYVCKTLAVEG